MQTAKTDMAEICHDIHQVILMVARSNPHAAGADVLDMLGRLDQADKRSLWSWLGQYDPNLRQWLINQRRAV